MEVEHYTFSNIKSLKKFAEALDAAIKKEEAKTCEKSNEKANHVELVNKIKYFYQLLVEKNEKMYGYEDLLDSYECLFSDELED